MKEWENEIVGDPVMEDGYLVYYNFKGEVVCKLKEDVAKVLEDYHKRLYKVKCESSAEMIESLAKGLLETANNVRKEV